MVIAARDIGVRERPGPAVHPRIAEYYEHTHLDGEQNDDTTAWCAAAMSCWLDEAGYLSPNTARARKYLDWGETLQAPRFGCIVVFSRGSAGHVAFYCGEGEPGCHLVLGGNQRNTVRFASDYEIARVLGYRWPRDLDKLTV